MRETAAKGRRLLFLAAVLVLVGAFLTTVPAEASRTLNPPITATLEPPSVSLETLERITEETDDRAENRFRLFEDLSLPPHPLEWVLVRKTASGVFDLGIECNVWEIGGLSQDCSSPSFQGLWTDPTTGLSYARNRWYDARTASWLSEDPKGAIDSPNLYAFVAWQPHMYTDPFGKEVQVTPTGGYVITDPQGGVRTFTAEQATNNPFALEAAIRDSNNGDWDQANHEVMVANLTGSHVRRTGSLPEDDKIIGYTGNGRSAVMGDGRVASGEGNLEPHYIVEETIVVAVTLGQSLVLSKAAGATTQQLVKSTVKNVGDEAAEAVFGFNPTDVMDLGRLAKEGASNLIRKPKYAPNPQKWESKGGRIFQNDDGTVTYVDWEGNSVTYYDDVADFGPHSTAEVEIDEVVGDHYFDYKAANSKAGYGEGVYDHPSGTVWHHKAEKTMQNADSTLHSRFTHKGTVSDKKR